MDVLNLGTSIFVNVNLFVINHHSDDSGWYERFIIRF